MVMTQTEPAADRLDLGSDVERRIGQFFADRVLDADRYGSEYAHLWRAAARASAGGKRIRPMLVLVAHRGVHGADAPHALDLAVAFELLHTAFLLHDDVIDGDEVRRGVPNVVGEFGADARRLEISEARAEQWGRTAAILAGDLLIHYSQSLVARLDIDHATRIRLLDVLDSGVFTTAAGELADVSYSVGVAEAQLTDALATTERKTAAYSFEAPLVAGAVLGGADPECVSALAECGRQLGIAFQLGDDLLGTFGDEGVTGKSAVNDLREGKETPLIAFARATGEWDHVGRLFGKSDLSIDEGAALRAALESCGARSFVEDLVADHVRRAIAALDDPAVPAGLAAQLEAYARTCIGRIA
jgi:geranylgeranyl diphosphate synthase type II